MTEHSKTTRSSQDHVRNPVLALPSAEKVLALPPAVRQLLAQLFREMALDARDRANESWRRHKAPMAVYWKAVSVYAGHIARAVRP